MNFCILSPQGLAGVALLWSPAAPVLLPAAGYAPRDTFTLPQPHLPCGDTRCHPQLVRGATCFSANKI